MSAIVGTRRMTKRKRNAVALYSALDLLAFVAFISWHVEMYLSHRVVRHPPAITIVLWGAVVFAFPVALLLAVLVGRGQASSRPLEAFFGVSQICVGLTWVFFTWALIVNIGLCPN